MEGLLILITTIVVIVKVNFLFFCSNITGWTLAIIAIVLLRLAWCFINWSHRSRTGCSTFEIVRLYSVEVIKHWVFLDDMLLVADELGEIIASINWPVMTLRSLFCYVKALATPLALPNALPLTLCDRIALQFRTWDRASGHPSFAIWIKSNGEGLLCMLMVFGYKLGQDVVDVFMTNRPTLHEQVVILRHSLGECLVIDRLDCFLAAKNLISDDGCDKLIIIRMAVL